MDQVDTVQHLRARWARKRLGDTEQLLVLIAIVSICRVKRGENLRFAHRSSPAS